ncbi:MAG: hypothetical protein AB9856_12480 [Cellulosilyticaceae bacterium]
MKKLSKILGFLGISIAVLAFIIFAPTFKLSTSKMVTKEGDSFILHYEPQDENVANDLIESLQQVTDTLNDKDFAALDKKTGIYIYPNLDTFHTKKYGLLGKFISSKEYIGDNVFTDVIVVSPNVSDSQYSYDDVISTATHEYARTIVYQINSSTPKLLSEGLAGYLSGTTKPAHKLAALPRIEDTHIGNPAQFKLKGMEDYAYTYVEYLNKTYGMDKVLNLTLHPYQYKGILGATEEQVYANWCQYLKENYLS